MIEKISRAFVRKLTTELVEGARFGVERDRLEALLMRLNESGDYSRAELRELVADFTDAAAWLAVSAGDVLDAVAPQLLEAERRAEERYELPDRRLAEEGRSIFPRHGKLRVPVSKRGSE